MKKFIHVYHLVDPRTKIVRYIGKTANPKSRLNAHIKDSELSDNTEKKRWIRDLTNHGIKPVMVVVASFEEEYKARLRESAECKLHLSTIYNIHDPEKGAKDVKR